MTDRDMDDQTCLFVLTLLMDGRDVPPGQAEAARRWAAAHPACRAALDELASQSAALAGAPGRRAPPGFADRVLAAAGVGPGTSLPEPVLPFVRRMALAAGLVLAATLAFGSSTPSGLHADDRLEKQRHVVDHFKDSPFATDHLVQGLRERIADDRAFAVTGGR